MSRVKQITFNSKYLNSRANIQLNAALNKNFCYLIDIKLLNLFNYLFAYDFIKI
jgi:hypothetical protein